jgi:PAS domain S-box-containing protein
MKLSKRFLFIPLILAIFAYLFYSAYQDVKDRTLNEFNFQQFALAKQASRGIESFFIYYQRELLFLSKLKYVSELNDQGRNLLADFYNNHSDQIEAITIVDENGILKYTFPYNESAIGQDISNQKHVKAVMESHKPTVSDVFTTVQGYRAIAYHIPIFDTNEYKGSIAILIPLDNLGIRFIENIRTGRTGYGCMISEEGIELFSPFEGQTGKSAREIYREFPSILELIDKSSKEKEGISLCYFNTVTLNKKELSRTISAFYRIPLGNTYWTILIFTPEREVFATLSSFRNRLLILFSLIFIVIGTYFYFALKASSILKEEKKRTALELILRESEVRFRTMFELSPAGIILIDEKGAIIEVNSSFCETLGYSRKELISKNIRIFTSPEKQGVIEKNIAEILSGKTLKHEVINFKKDGTTCVIDLYETMIILPDGKQGILSVSNDISERKKVHLELISAKDKAEESDRLKSAFLANMSHELRTPLNAIIGFSGLMIDAGSDNETTSNLKIILNSGQHLLSLVEEILDISMIETEQIKIKYEKVEISSILYDVKNIIEGEKLKEFKTGIELVLNFNPETSNKVILTDSRKIKQVLINLLKNSIKFTDEGFVEFGIAEIKKGDTDYFKFYVKDTGIGIDKKYHDVIFNIFRQIDDTHTRKYGGTGIGLSVAKKIVEMLGGEIWVESEQEKGSTFYFTIPVLSENKQTEIQTSDSVIITEKRFDGKTVLIAEDEVPSFKFLNLVLTKMNIRVLWAKNGIEVVDLCKTDPSINLILMDIKMPLLNGYEATRQIKRIRPELPVIAQTAYATISDKAESLNAGCDDYLSKPIQIGQLKDLLRKYL